MDRLEYLLPQQDLFGTVADFCLSTFMFSLLSVISLLTYFDVLECFSPFRSLLKVGIWCKKHTPENSDGMLRVGLYSNTKRKSPVHTLCSAAERVLMLERDLSTDSSDQCYNPKYRKIFMKLHRKIHQMDSVLQGLSPRCSTAVRDSQNRRGDELNWSIRNLLVSPEGNTQQNNTKSNEVVTARDRQRIQLLSSRLQSMKIYTEERLKLLNSFASCYESYQLLYYKLHNWVARTNKFQEWIHSTACDSETLIITNLTHQKKIVEEIEERAPQLSDCQRTQCECVHIFKQMELQASSFKSNLKKDQPLTEKDPVASTFPSSIHQEFTDLKQQFLDLIRLTRCYVTHLRDLLRMERRQGFYMLKRQRQKGTDSSTG